MEKTSNYFTIALQWRKSHIRGREGWNGSKNVESRAPIKSKGQYLRDK